MFYMLFITTLIVFPLIIGGLIYIGFRPDNLLMFSWFQILGIDSVIFVLRDYLSQFDLLSWMIFWVPNGSWTFAFTAALTLIWLKSITPYKFIWITIPFILGITMEVGQLLNILPGTFCYGDIIAHTIGAFSAFIIAYYLIFGKFKDLILKKIWG